MIYFELIIASVNFSMAIFALKEKIYIKSTILCSKVHLHVIQILCVLDCFWFHTIFFAMDLLFLKKYNLIMLPFKKYHEFTVYDFKSCLLSILCVLIITNYKKIHPIMNLLLQNDINPDEPLDSEQACK